MEIQRTDPGRAEEILQVVVAEELVAVVFGQDYVQLGFDGPSLTALSHPTVEVGGTTFHWDEPGFRDALCGRIGRTVRAAKILPSHSVIVEFDDASVIRIPIDEAETATGESAHLSMDSAYLWVL
jgi:hypothetical protein